MKQQLKNSHVVLAIDQSADGAGDPIAHIVAIPPSGVPFLLEEVGVEYCWLTTIRFLIIRSNTLQKI